MRHCALSEQQERRRDFAEMGADLFWESDAQGCFKYLSEGYKTLTAVASKKMLGQPIGHSSGPALLPEHHLKTTDATGAHLPLHDHTIDWELPDGRAVVLLSNALPIVDGEAVFRGFHGTVRDITEQHRLTEKLKHQATHDDLTELGNRREFERRLGSMLLVSGSRLDTIDMCSINLSGHSLSDEDFVDYLSQRFRDQALPAHKICFEITETAAMTNLNAAIGFMERLRRFGCRFALDDFGTGLSSFGYLRNLPVDYIKIDGLFVRDMVDDKVDFAMVKSIYEMGRVMGKQTVAEYVESEEILELLRDIGVDYAQGYSVDKPQPMAAYGIGGKLVELDVMAGSV